MKPLTILIVCLIALVSASCDPPQLANAHEYNTLESVNAEAPMPQSVELPTSEPGDIPPTILAQCRAVAAEDTQLAMARPLLGCDGVARAAVRRVGSAARAVVSAPVRLLTRRSGGTGLLSKGHRRVFRHGSLLRRRC
jgi:hypothetical protein